MRRTKIVATLGPASASPDTLARLLSLGVDVVRLNLSHGSCPDHAERIRAVRRVEADLRRPIGIMIDTRGPELRLGKLREEPLQLADGDRFRLYWDGRIGDRQGASVNWPDLAADLASGALCLIDDGKLSATVLAVQSDHILLAIQRGGLLYSGKKVTFPTLRLRLPSLTDQDRQDLAALAELGYDFVAQSFVQDPTDVLTLREWLEGLHVSAQIIAKVECGPGVEHVESIARVADGLMVARGDLGVAFPVEEVPVIQKRLIAVANRLGKPVVTATQMLESMVEHAEPTRAEATDVANAIWDGSDAVMLSAETAVGRHAEAAVSVMARIAERADSQLTPRLRAGRELATVTEAVSRATCEIAAGLRAKAIVTATQSGHTARMVARHRPSPPIVAATPSLSVARQLTLVWGVLPHQIEQAWSSDQLVAGALRAVQESGVAEEGDTVVVTFGVPVGLPGTTNVIQVRTIGNAVLRGQGLGGQIVSGPVHRIEHTRDRCFLPEGVVVVTRATDASMAESLRRARAIVAEEGGLTSHAALLGVALGIPVIVGAEGALHILQDGEIVTVDARRGVVYRGQPSL